MKSTVFWDITPCSPSKEASEEYTASIFKVEEKALLPSCFHAGFLLGFFFDLEYAGDMFLRNVD
jgi:hypothetical protein